MAISRRGKKGTFQILMRVPKRFADIHKSSFFQRSLHTESRQIAERKADRIWKLQIACWEAQTIGEIADSERLYAELKKIAEMSGFEYIPQSELSKASLSEIIDRIDAVDSGQIATADAILGRSERPTIPLTQLLGAYIELKKVEVSQKSKNQLRQWESGLRRTVDNFTNTVGDKDVLCLSRRDAVKYRLMLAARIENGEIVAYSANRDLYTLGNIIKTVTGISYGKEVDVFSNILFDDKKTKRRRRQVSFTPEWIKEKFLSENALSGMNQEAKSIFLLMINTGARPSEISGLLPDAIILNHDVPHIKIYPNQREIKTIAAERDIPLVGNALEIMRQNPNGFPRYFDKSTAWSALVAKYLKAHDLLPTPEHRAYSLRHSFENRLQNANCPDRIFKELMGHEISGTPYGEGVWLSVARDWLLKVKM